MSRNDKKQRNAAKRAQKKREARKLNSMSPLKRLADLPGEPECWGSRGFEQNRQISIHVFKRGGGMSGMVCFLIDRGVVGLKDVWNLIPCELSQKQKLFEGSRERGIVFERLTPTETIAWVAGAARWAHDNGMRLPKDWQKMAAVIGPVGDWQAADTSRFRKEFVGHPEDLRQRLISEPFETYLRRTDVEFTLTEDVTYLDQETGKYISPGGEDLDDDAFTDEELEEMFPDEEVERLMTQFEPTAMHLASQTIKWLEAKGETPSSELLNAWCSMVFSKLMSSVALSAGNASESDETDLAADLLKQMIRRADVSDVEELRRAVGQCFEHLQTNSMLMSEAATKMGLELKPK